MVFTLPIQDNCLKFRVIVFFFLFAGVLWCVTFLEFISYFSRETINPDLWTGCKLSYFLHYFVTHNSSALLVIMSVEKCLALYFPFKTKSICTVKVAKRVTLVTALVFVAFDSQFFFIIKKVSNSFCSFVRVPESYPLIFDRIDSVLYSFGPFTIMTLANCLIIYKFVNAICQNRQSGTESTSQALTKFAGKGTVMLVTISVTFIILTGPISIIYLITLTPHPLVRVIMHVLSDLNHAINGVLYCIVGSRFRNELVKTLSYCKAKRSRSNMATVSKNSCSLESTVVNTF